MFPRSFVAVSGPRLPAVTFRRSGAEVSDPEGSLLLVGDAFMAALPRNLEEDGK